uniref:Alpha-amylase n=1 Tax=Culicoides sonorensis TaxID=179676 RepID=A0A336MEQ5_CULSO
MKFNIIVTFYLHLFMIPCIFGISHNNPQFLPDRTGIVHLFEWKWKDIARECEVFLGPNGYAGVQVSPVQENVIIANRPWYERYQPQSYKLITRSGNEEDFLDMTKRCTNAGIRIYVDIVFNHMAAHQGIGTAGTISNVSELDFPGVPFSKTDFHANCDIQDYTNASQVRNCRLVSLPDLDQSKSWVREKIVEMMNKLIKLGVAGFRVDAAKHMWPQDLEVIYNIIDNLNTEFNFPRNSRPFIVQEVIDLGGEGITKYEYNYMAAVTEFKFSADIGKCFRGKTPLANMKNWGEEWGFLPSKDALVFVDNHDNQRGHGAGGEDILTYKNKKEYTMAVAFMLAHPYGIPRIMSSFAFSNSDQGPPMNSNGELITPEFDSQTNQCSGNDWVCEHRWPEIHKMIQFRNKVENSLIKHWWDNGDKQIAFEREAKGFIAFNLQPDTDLVQEFKTTLPAGTYCDIISGTRDDAKKCTGKSFTVSAEGKMSVTIPKDDQFGFIAVLNNIKSRCNFTSKIKISLNAQYKRC